MNPDDTDLYKVLNVDENSTLEDIKKQYKLLALKYHPDRNHGDDTKFKQIKNAYDILSDEEKRKQYSYKFLKPTSTLNEFFKNMFNSGKEQQKVIINLSIQDILYGCYKDYQLEHVYACTTCKETGISNPEKNTIQCRECFGKGVNPTISFLSCITCQGHGIFVLNNKLCNVCNGEKKITSIESRQIYIKPGNRNNDIIEVSNSVVLIIKHTYDDDIVRIDNMNVHITIQITILELLCGFIKEIIYADERIIVRSEKLFDVFKPFVVPNKGVNEQGDLIFHFNLLCDTENPIYNKIGKSLNLLLKTELSKTPVFSEQEVINIE